MKYEAIVIDNNDPLRIGQIKARVMGFMDDVRDEDLPWLRPTPFQLEGLKATGNGTMFGILAVPMRGGKVTVMFPTSSIFEGVYSNEARMNEAEALPEGDINYPMRLVFRISTGTQLIIDRSTNEMFLNTSGDYHMTVMGDMTQTIVGNQQVIVANDKSQIPDYIRNDPVMTPSQLTPDPKKRLAFRGQARGNAGNQYTHIYGNKTEVIEGDHRVEVRGTSKLIAREHGIESSGEVTVNGSSINLN